jgi:hypothetical protein
MCVLKYSVTDVGLVMNKNRECYAHSPFGFRICYTYSTSVAFEKTDSVGLRTNMTVRSHTCIYCCSIKAIHFAYSKCLSVALVIHYEIYMRHIILSSVTCLTTVFFHIISQTARFSKRN